ncbi:MAG: beta-CASP ribonuclease aCPSF1 [Candidatus Hermodarchaeia archaeon]|jgi:KH/beta-lactamase-domain protein
MAIEDPLDAFRQRLLSKLPRAASVTDIEFEGPEIAIYARKPREFDEKTNVKELAKQFRKRIVIRSDPSVRMMHDQAEEEIRKIVPEEAEITDITFNETIGEVIIEAKKPGLVIGRTGTTMEEIRLKTFWRPSVIRTPPLKSDTILKIRHALQNSSEERKTILRTIGRRIHRPPLLKEGYIRLTPLGGFREVGRMSMLVQTPESSVMIDCGVNVGATAHAFPRFDLPELDLAKLDAVVITHSHLDHCGMTPFLFKYGYEGPVYCTSPTQDLMTMLQIDYLEVARREGKVAPYGLKDIRKLIMHTVPLNYGEVTDIAPDVRLTLHNAGHILGSSIAHLHIGDGLYNLAYTGDFKYARSRLLEPATDRFPRLETLIMESTYGAPRDLMPSRKNSERQLVDYINRTLERGGKVLIPVLAVGRAQELLVVIDEYMRRGTLQEAPVFVDGMIIEATAIHTAHPEYLARELRDKIFHQGQNPFLAEYFTQVDGHQVRDEILEAGPCVILATSGMLTGGPSVEYFKQLAGDDRNSIIFVSYQVEGTLGRRIQKGRRQLPMRNSGDRRDVVKVDLQIHTVEGFSGHSDRRQLVDYARRIQPKPERILTCHGEASKCINLASHLHRDIGQRRRLETRSIQNFETIRLF